MNLKSQASQCRRKRATWFHFKPDGYDILLRMVSKLAQFFKHRLAEYSESFIQNCPIQSRPCRRPARILKSNVMFKIFTSAICVILREPDILIGVSWRNQSNTANKYELWIELGKSQKEATQYHILVHTVWLKVSLNTIEHQPVKSSSWFLLKEKRYTLASKGMHKFVIMRMFETVPSQLIIHEYIQMCNFNTKVICCLWLQLGVHVRQHCSLGWELPL